MTDQVTKNIIVKGDLSDIYELWANFEYFPHFMKNIKSVRKTGEDTSHWVMEGPMGRTFEWDTETTRLEENKRVAWRTTEGDLQTSGQVTFTALPQNETQVNVTMQYVPPAGKLGDAIARLFDDPERRLEEDLHNFKDYVENRPDRLPQQ